MKVDCRDCGTKFETEPIYWRGKQIIPPSALCETCWDAEEKREAEEKRRSQWQLNKAAALMPKQYWDRPLPSGPVGERLAAWARGDIELLILSGPVGVGKTWAAAAACWQAWWHRPVRWVEVARAMTQLRASFGDEDRAKALSAFTGDGSVVLDDIDKVPGTEAGLTTLFSALDTRVASGVPVLVTMNSSIGELAQQIDRGKGGFLGDAIASRLSAGELIRVGGQDKRRAA